MSEKLKRTACPTCGELILALNMVFKAKPITEGMVSGSQMKVLASELPRLTCENPAGCDFEKWGYVTEDGYAQF